MVDIGIIIFAVITATTTAAALYYRRELKIEQRSTELLGVALKRSGVGWEMSTTKDGERLVVEVTLNATARGIVIEQFLGDLEAQTRRGIGEIMEHIGDDKVGEMLERPSHLATLGFESAPPEDE